MKTTKIIGNVDRFKNIFTKYGRNKNNLIIELEAKGFSEFRERTLKDKSQVLLAYEEDKNLSGYAFRLFPDLSMEQKHYTTSHAIFNIPIRIQKISKIFADKKGNEIKECVKKLRYQNNTLVEKEERINDYVKDFLIEKEEVLRGTRIPSLNLNNVIKSYIKVEKDNLYSFYQQKDGTRHYIKDIDGVKYSFSSK